jgi:TolA-binding protein
VKKPTKAVKPAPKKAVRAPRAPVVAKADLRASIEKLEGQIATLRTKNRETNKALKVAEARIAELEAAAEKAAPKVVASQPKTAPANKPAAKKPVAKKPAQKKAAPKVVEPVVETELADDAVQPESLDTAPTE